MTTRKNLAPASRIRNTRRRQDPSRLLVLATALIGFVAFEARAAQVALSWRDNSNNEIGFKVERTSGTGAYVEIATTAANVVSYTDTTVAGSSSYKYRVRSFTNAGSSAPSNIAAVTTPPTGANTAPTISDIANQTIGRDGAMHAIGFTVGDVETPAASLIVSSISSNPTLVPNASIVFGGAGANRTVTITPVAKQSGSSTITISVSDGAATRSDTFLLTVNTVAPVNQPPTITGIPNQSGTIDNPIGPIAFTIADSESATASLTVSTSSSNSALVPLSGLAPGGSGANRTITITPNAGRTGTATIFVSVSDGSEVTSTRFTITIDPAPPIAARLLNLSTRVVCRPNRESLIPGFVISGTTDKRVLLRAVGPTLGAAPFDVPGALPDPRVVLKRWNGSAFVDVASNDNWNSGGNGAEIRQVSASLLAFALPSDSRDAALLLDLAPGQYTVVADEVDGSSGVVILEIYDTDTASGGSSFINLSNRGYVGTGAEVMISGFVVSDAGPQTLLVRAIGPALAGPPYNVPDTIRDPMIEIHRRNSDGSDTLVAAHDNWGEDGDAAATAQIAQQVAAFPLPSGSKDAAFAATFAPGVYTAIVRGVNGATGCALVEVYTVEK